MIALVNFLGLSATNYIFNLSFIWVVIFCFINFIQKGSLSWFFASVLFSLLMVNAFWGYDLSIASWLVSEKRGLLLSIDKVAPFLKVEQHASIWLMFIVYLLLFISLIVSLAQIAYKRFTSLVGFAGFVIYLIAFSWWLYWALSAPSGVSAGVIMIFKGALLSVGNLFFIVSFILALRR